MDISDSTVSRITDKILPSSSHVRSEGRIVKRAVYIALDMDMNGKKDVLVIACVDGLTGFPQAIEAYTRRRRSSSVSSARSGTPRNLCPIRTSKS